MSKLEKQRKIGQAIKQKRDKLEMTQEELALKTKLSRNYISDVECGRYMPSVDTLSNIARYLDLDLNFLIRNDGNTSFEEEGEKIC